MRRLLMSGTITSLIVAIALISWAATNLNSSKSNVYRLVYPADLVTSAQAAAILADLDKSGQVDEAKLRQLLQQQILPKNGVQVGRIRTISVGVFRQMACSDCAFGCEGRCVQGPCDMGQCECFCYEHIPTRAQGRMMDKASPILILLLTKTVDEAQALEAAMSAIRNMK